MASRSAERADPPDSNSTSANRHITRNSNSGFWPLLALLDFAFCMWLVKAGWLELWPGLFAGVSVAAICMIAVVALDQQGTVRHMRALVHHRDKVADALRAERDLAADSSASRTRFFAAASHDLRQPLHALSINATTLQLVAGRQDDPVIRDLSLSINRALSRSNGLLDSLLDLSRLDANAVKLKLEPVSVLALLTAVCDQFRPSAEAAGLSLDVGWPPALSADVRIVCDVVLMFRVMGNLLGNAIKFTDAGRVHVAVSVSGDDDDESDGDDQAGGCKPEQRFLTISVSDTGRGIDAHELPHIFEEFYQVAGAQRDADGSLGLGLSIVRRAVDLMGMAIEVQSVVGEGTVVALQVPSTSMADGAIRLMSGTADTSLLDEPEAVRAEQDYEPGDPIKVLLIEDEKEICDSLQNFLPYLGHEIRSAGNSSEALALLASGFIPGVLVIDQLLREETGLLVVHRLWRVLGRVPAVMITGDTDLSTAELALASGMRLVHKPIDGMRLARILREVQSDRTTG